MANTVYNRLAISGPPADLAALVERLRGPDLDDGDERVLDFRRHVPIPDDLDLSSSSTGLPPSYIWAVDNWGTKWNAIYPEIEGNPGSGCVRYDFETAWTTADAWLFVVSAAHPTLTFDHEFWEEFDQFAGRARLRAGELEHFEHLEGADLDWVTFEEDEE